MTSWVIQNAQKNLDRTPRLARKTICVDFSTYSHPQKFVDCLNEAYQKVPLDCQEDCIFNIDYGEDYLEGSLTYNQYETPEEVDTRVKNAQKTIEAHSEGLRKQYEDLKKLFETEKSEKSSENNA